MTKNTKTIKPEATSAKEVTTAESNKENTDGIATSKPEVFKLRVLEDDDAFEDFPADAYDECDPAVQADLVTDTHKWEDTWEDDDTTEDFATQLAHQIKLVR